MPFTDDAWIESRRPIEAEKLHAIGYITFIWNTCEFHLFEMLCLTFGLPPKMAWILVHDLGDIALSERIKSYLKLAFDEPEKVADISAVITNALAAYNICRLNRNQFTHFQLQHNQDEDRIALARQKGPKLERVPFPDSLTEMRRVGDEIWGLSIYMSKINGFLRRNGEDKDWPLPGKVDLPALVWTPPR